MAAPAAPAAVLLLGALGAVGCARAPSGPSTLPHVILTSQSGAAVRVSVEVASSDAERARGLMYRRRLDDGAGMLFLFPTADRLKFWMRNTYIPLDMIFLDADRKIVYIEENAEPLTDTPRGPDAPAQFVLEVPGGWARAHGIEPGTPVQFALR